MAFVPASLLPTQYIDPSDGTPAAGFTLSAFISGTTTPATIYGDKTGTPLGTTVTLNAAGYPSYLGSVVSLWVDNNFNYKFILRDAEGVTEWTVDALDALAGSGGVGGGGGGGTPGATGVIGYVNTIADLRLNDVNSFGYVYSAGTNEVGDGGEGWWYIDDLDEISTDNTGTRVVDSQMPRTGTWKRLSTDEITKAAWFGVVPGAWDQTAADLMTSWSNQIEFQEGTYIDPVLNFTLAEPIKLVGRNTVFSTVTAATSSTTILNGSASGKLESLGIDHRYTGGGAFTPTLSEVTGIVDAEISGDLISFGGGILNARGDITFSDGSLSSGDIVALPSGSVDLTISDMTISATAIEDASSIVTIRVEDSTVDEGVDILDITSGGGSLEIVNFTRCKGAGTLGRIIADAAVVVREAINGKIVVSDARGLKIDSSTMSSIEVGLTSYVLIENSSIQGLSIADTNGRLTVTSTTHPGFTFQGRTAAPNAEFSENPNNVTSDRPVTLYKARGDAAGNYLDSPAGWLYDRGGTVGSYTVTHNLGTLDYGIVATAGSGGRYNVEYNSKTTNTFVLSVRDVDVVGTLVDSDIDFLVWV